MPGTNRDRVSEILDYFQTDNASKVVLTGEAGSGKTWVTRMVCESARRQGFSFGSIWIAPAENPGEKDLLHIIASQLLVSPSPEDDEDSDEADVEANDDKDVDPASLKQRIVEKLQKAAEISKNQAPKIGKGTSWKAQEKKFKESGAEGMPGKRKYLIVVLYYVTKDQEKSILRDLFSILPVIPVKILIARKELRDDSEDAAIEVERDTVLSADETMLIQLRPLSSQDDALKLLEKHVKAEIRGNRKLEDIAEKVLGLPSAAVILVAGALNHAIQDEDRIFEIVNEDAADLNQGDMMGVLRFAYNMLPDGVTQNCYWISRQLFLCRDAIHFNELIAYWILEGCFDHHNRIEKAYKEGYHILMDLKRRGILKGHNNYISMERTMFKLPDERRDGFSGAAKLGIWNVLADNDWVGLGSIAVANGMIKAVSRGQQGKELSMLLVDGSHLHRAFTPDFIKSIKGLRVLAIFNPMFDDIPHWLTELKDLQVLVMRGCQHLKKADEIRSLDKLLILEISAAPLLRELDQDIFKDMASLRSVNLSGLNISSLPYSLFDRVEVIFLILRDCINIKELPSLRNMRNLEMVDLCGSESFAKLSDGNISPLTELKTLNISGTEIKTSPIFGNIDSLTRVLLRNCTALIMVRSLEKMKNLEVLDISGSTSIQELNSARLHGKPQFRLLDISGVGISAFPDNISDLCHLRLKGCQRLKILPSTSTFRKLESLDLSGASMLTEVSDEFFAHLKSLRRLDLSENKIRQLPPLSDLVELRELVLKSCKHLTELRGVVHLRKLEVIDLSGCISLKISPEESFCLLYRLQVLDLSETKIEVLPHDCFPSNLSRLSLRDCKRLITMPSLESLLKLEELDMCGAESLPKYKAGFLSAMPKLKVLNLSKTHPYELPSLSHLTNLVELSLSGCPGMSLNLWDLEGLKELQLLDLSGTKVQSSLPLGIVSKLRKLILRDCPNLIMLMDLEFLSHLEVLDLSRTGLVLFPDKVSSLTRLKELHLQDMMALEHIDWSWIHFLPAQVNLGTKPARISAISTMTERPSILVCGSDFFGFLEENSELWEKIFKDFHFTVYFPAEGTDNYKGMSSSRFINSYGRVPFPEKHRCLLEICGSCDFPGQLKGVIMRAQFISVIGNARFSRLSDLGSESASSMRKCWLERCLNLNSIFAGEEDISIGKRLESLYLCNLPSLQRLCAEPLQHGKLSDLKDLHLDCCPKLSDVFSKLMLPEKLETLTVKFCNGLETIFESEEPADQYTMPRMKTLELFGLPSLRSIGVQMPALETLKVRACESLPRSELDIFTNLKTKIIEA